MSKIIVGDFRGSALQAFSTELKDFEYDYILEDSADYLWFKDIGSELLSKTASNDSSVIIMVGFNDCVNSCIWSSFNIENIAKNFAEGINKLVEQYEGTSFYICSVCPVTADYATALTEGGTISKSSINMKIKKFNAALKSSCEVTYLDLYSYFESANLLTVDGVHFNEETSVSILCYIDNSIKGTGGSLFVPRTTKPEYDPDRGYINPLWLGDYAGGLNPFSGKSMEQPEYNRYVGDVLPNCTGYAWGRFYEILGSRPTLCQGYGGTHNAEMWYLDTSDGYKRGQEPALGAVICWRVGDTYYDGADGMGHVAIVEAINEDGSITISESGWGCSWYWQLVKIWKDENGNWDYGVDSKGNPYHFQGFIYCPTTTAVTKDEIRSENDWGVFKVDDAMKKNAQYIWQYLGARGWTINAVAALLGNLQSESGMSPIIWEDTLAGSIIDAKGNHTLNNEVLQSYFTRNGRFPGYGLVQWTPYTKYTDWCKSGGRNLKYWDIDSQLERIIWEVENNVWGLAYYNEGYTFEGESFDSLSFKTFIKSTKDAGWLAAAFAFCYEKPGSSTPKSGGREELCRVRSEQGEFWYQYLNSLPPIGTTNELQLENIKLDKCNSTSVTLSCLIHGATKASYTLNSGQKKEFAFGSNYTILDISDLTPNTKYKIKITVEDSSEKKIEKDFSFTTKQDFPKSISEIILKTDDTRLPNDNFMVTVTPSSPDFGYWKHNDHGYSIQLIVNGAIVYEGSVNSLQTRYSLSADFNYKAKLGDIIQIGLRTWVKYDGEILYDSTAAKASNTICMLKKPIMTFLNID